MAALADVLPFTIRRVSEDSRHSGGRYPESKNFRSWPVVRIRYVARKPPLITMPYFPLFPQV